MELKEKLGTRPDSNNIKISWGLFWCPACKIGVERQLSNGHRNKTCGCQRHIRDMSSPKEEKRNRLQHQKARQYATLHCKHYNQGPYSCLNRAVRNGNEINCYRCEFFEEIKNTYRKELIAGDCRTGFSETTEHLIKS